MQTQNHPLALAAAIFIAGMPATHAAEPEPLGPVQVTASRIEETAGDAFASVTVLTREDIARAQAPDVIELLARQAGVDVARSGGPGQASTLFLRGGNSHHALVLVDGIRVNAATQGVLDFAHLPLAMIERIEIVRGPRAALWGSDAIGGVVQVFTRDPAQDFVEARVGSYGRRGLDAGMGLGDDEASLGVALGYDRLTGFSATTPVAFGHDPDQDGYSNRHGALRAQASLGSQRISASALVTDADVDFDAGVGPGVGRTAATNRVFGARLAGALTGDWRHELVLGHSSEDLDTPAYLSRFGSRRNSVDWMVTRPLAGSGALTLGANWSREDGYSYEYFEGYEVARRNAALFARWQGGIGAHRVETSLRHDDNSQFGGATTANLGWSWRAAEALRLRASWGQGFRAPNFNELYYPGFDIGSGARLFAGNPDLQPERSHTAEAGLDWDPVPGRHLGVSAYRTRLGNLISFDGLNDDQQLDFHAINTRRAAVDGLELETRLEQGAWRVDGNLTWQHARDLDTRADLLRRARRKANLGVTRRFGADAQWGVDVSAVSRRAEFDGQSLGGYLRVDLRFAAPLAGDWWFDARLENLGDHDYELVRGYRTAGRSGMIGLRWQGQ